MTRCFSISAIVFEAALLAAAPAARGASPVPLPALLDRVGRQTQKFWDYLPAVTCTESLTQAKLDAKGKSLYQEKTSYDYLILLQSSGTDVSVDESRVQKDHRASKGKASLLETQGFAILALIFHPLYQASYEFTEMGEDTLDGQTLLRVGFRHLGNERSPSDLRLGKRDYPLAWKGTAWIDPASYAIVRIVTDLGNPMDDVGLLKLSADVTYSGIHFADTTSIYWLPVRAVVEASTRRQRWRNVDLFTGYRRFSVETEVKTGAPPMRKPNQ